MSASDTRLTYIQNTCVHIQNSSVYTQNTSVHIQNSRVYTQNASHVHKIWCYVFYGRLLYLLPKGIVHSSIFSSFKLIDFREIYDTDTMIFEICYTRIILQNHQHTLPVNTSLTHKMYEVMRSSEPWNLFT